MKKVFVTIFIACMWFITLYFITSFSHMDLNPYNFDFKERNTISIITVIGTVLTWALIQADNKK